MYIYQDTNWPGFTWDDKSLLILLSKARNLQGKLIGKMEAIGFSLREEAMLKTLTIDIVKSNEIEGKLLNSVMASVRIVTFLSFIGIYVLDFRVLIIVNLITYIGRHPDILILRDISFG